MDYASGSDDVSVSVKPYGLLPARSSKAFQTLPSITLGTTFAAMYAAVRVAPNLFKKWVKHTRPNISSAWPRGMMLRYETLMCTFAEKRMDVFDSYEQLSGSYMGEECASPTKRRRTSTAFDVDSDFDN